MALSDDLTKEVKTIFSSQWATRKGTVVPEPSDIKLGNEAVILDPATILYADLSGSTKLVDSYKWEFAAEIYKAYLHCAAKIVKSQGGVITSYDGDRIMAVFIGDKQSSSAVRTALKINYCVQKIINPALKEQYKNVEYEVKQVLGIDRSKISATRTGVRGDNDIVWVGRAANYAAKLTELKLNERTWITKEVYDVIADDCKISNGTNMWKSYNWSQNDNKSIYGSTYWWTF